MLDERILKGHIDPSLNLFSRIHKSLCLSSKNAHVFIKRDDELSAMISGSKYRKYAGLLPFLKNQKIKNCILMGSSFSNHLVGFPQLLIENNITPYTVTLSRTYQKEVGNLVYLKSIIPSSNRLELPSDLWSNRVEISKKYFSDLVDSFILDEGGESPFSILGAMSIALDLQKQGPFDHIFVDVGSGLSAIGLLIGLNFVSYTPLVHVVSMAISNEQFENKYNDYLKKLEGLLSFPLRKYKYTFEHAVPKSFGSTSPTLFKKIINVVRSEGVFFDPLYGIKLYGSAEKFIETSNGKILIIHSGGVQSLSGFQEQLKKAITQEEKTFFSNSKDHSHK